jgi:hypothetical protein
MFVLDELGDVPWHLMRAWAVVVPAHKFSAARHDTHRRCLRCRAYRRAVERGFESAWCDGNPWARGSAEPGVPNSFADLIALARPPAVPRGDVSWLGWFDDWRRVRYVVLRGQ